MAWPLRFAHIQLVIWYSLAYLRAPPASFTQERPELRLLFVCKSGRHRSVALALLTASYLHTRWRLEVCMQLLVGARTHWLLE